MDNVADSYGKLMSLRHELERKRKVKKPIHSLSDAKKKKLLSMSVDDFFSQEFLAISLKPFYSRRDLSSAPNILSHIKAEWPHAQKIADLLVMQPALCNLLTRRLGFGGSALTLLVDAFMAFGYEVKYKPVIRTSKETAAQKRAKEIARDLGIR